MLSLYEASYHSIEGEEELDEAGKIAMEHLICLDRSLLCPQLVEEIDHALEIPLHWRMLRIHTRWFIDAYGRRENFNPTLLELAKLDFNIVQSIYKTELQEMSMWWKNLGLACTELNFIRDRLVENYFWAVGFTFQPEFGISRKAITKIISLVATIDDIYDVYGALDELELFTNVVENLQRQLKSLWLLLPETIKKIAQEEKYIHRRDKLKEEVRYLIGQQHDLIKQLELQDAMRRLGLDYHFNSEIKNLLNSISSSKQNIEDLILNNNLHGSALLFRLLREHGINNAPILRVDALTSCFKKVRENFQLNHQHNIKEIISLYEASYLAVEGEEVLDEMRDFAVEYLSHLDRSLLSQELTEEIDHALELPLHWRLSRLHTRWYIDAYGKQENVNPVLLELAKLDFNIVPSIYTIELKEMSRWWRNIGLVSDEINFSRDRLVENFSLAVGETFQPKFWRCRKAITKINCFIALIDDIYDVYGTLDELKIFTNAIEDDLKLFGIIRWNIATAQQLPDPMKICLAALFSTMNNISSSFSIEKELDALLYLKRMEEIPRGEKANSVQCYMKEKDVSESIARDYTRHLVRNFWKKLNGELIEFSTSIGSFKEGILGVPRTAQFLYQNGDGYAIDDGKIRDQIFYMIIEPIPL
ncbi:terpene synthase 10-like [Phalaenopsis equestris]|uniref:terpene synthase 10-like n=1 Tax=Phalaenopsis equestris TaxID=78828 RepID=UPI0009E35607|nr:terpene synthase 10-like [Phalaenopsis equestris]